MLYLNYFTAIFLNLPLSYLTLTSVVFEFEIELKDFRKKKNLTLTSVVFECEDIILQKFIGSNLTLTSVVFEYKITWCRA